MADFTVEELTAKLATANANLGTQKGEAKAAFEARDELKRQLQVIEDGKAAADTAALAEQGKFKELAEAAQAKVLELTGNSEAVKAERESLEAQIEVYKVRDKAELDEILKDVPEAMRETITSDSIPLEKQLEIARGLVPEKKRGPGVKVLGEHEDVTLTEQHAQAMKDGNMELALSLKNKMYQKE